MQQACVNESNQTSKKKQVLEQTGYAMATNKQCTTNVYILNAVAVNNGCFIFFFLFRFCHVAQYTSIMHQ